MEEQESLLETNNTSHTLALRPQEVQVIARSTWLPHRFRLFILAFVCLFLHNGGRASFNIALVAMTNYTDSSLDNITTADRCPGSGTLNNTNSQEGEFDWNSSQQSQLLSAFYYGYVVLQFPGGYLSERWGGKRVLGCVSILTGLCILLSPLLARISFTAFMVVRVAVGLGSGPIFGCLFALASKWVPKYEVSWLLAYSFLGYDVGGVISFITSGMLIQSGFLGGWPSVFYIYGGLLVVWSMFWFALAADSPAKDAGISAQEREYIERNTDSRDIVKYRNPPFAKMLTSPAILSLWMICITDGYGFYFINSTLPIFMKQILAYDIQSDGLLIGLQYVGLIVSCLLASPLVDYLRTKGILSTRTVRVICTLIGAFSMAVAMLAIGLLFECNREAVIALLITGQFFLGVQKVGYPLVPMDIAPMYSGTVVGIGNCMGNIMGFIAPIIVGWLTGDSPSRREWSIAFVSTAVVLILGAIIYSIFTTGEELPWARVDYETKKTVSSHHDSDVIIRPTNNDVVPSSTTLSANNSNCDLSTTSHQQCTVPEHLSSLHAQVMNDPEHQEPITEVPTNSRYSVN